MMDLFILAFHILTSIGMIIML